MRFFRQHPFSFTIGFAANRKRLSNFNFEEQAIGVFMAPLEILLLLAPINLIEITIALMLLLEIRTVSTIFAAVPRMVVVAVSIVVAFFLVIFVPGPHYRGTDQAGAQHERAKN